VKDKGETMHKVRAVLLGTLAGVIGLAAQGTAGQGKASRPSPPAKAECKFTDGKNITVDYSSPRMKGRKIYGGLVPYGQVWRTGANEATSFVTTTALSINGTGVPAGSYTLFTIPNATGWELILSKKTGMWGTEYPGPGEDLLRAPMKVAALPGAVENFTIAFEQKGETCTMNVDWETTRVSIEIKR
jgi:hypothetical protein